MGFALAVAKNLSVGSNWCEEAQYLLWYFNILILQQPTKLSPLLCQCYSEYFDYIMSFIYTEEKSAGNLQNKCPDVS